MYNSQDNHAKIATAWACMTLRKYNCELFCGAGSIPNGPGWDILTPGGWEVAETWQELCVLAKDIQREAQSA